MHDLQRELGLVRPDPPQGRVVVGRADLHLVPHESRALHFHVQALHDSLLEDRVDLAEAPLDDERLHLQRARPSGHSLHELPARLRNLDRGDRHGQADQDDEDEQPDHGLHGAQYCSRPDRFQARPSSSHPPGCKAHPIRLSWPVKIRRAWLRHAEPPHPVKRIFIDNPAQRA